MVEFVSKQLLGGNFLPALLSRGELKVIVSHVDQPTPVIPAVIHMYNIRDFEGVRHTPRHDNQSLGRRRKSRGEPAKFARGLGEARTEMRQLQPGLPQELPASLRTLSARPAPRAEQGHD